MLRTQHDVCTPGSVLRTCQRCVCASTGVQAGLPAELSGRFKARERHCPKKQGDGLARWLQQVRTLAVPAW